MAKLTEYRDKRDFNKTPEPAGGGADSSTQFLYVIQKHQASRLHYDLRLELDGVLLSWAVPKGPSLDPAEKRLAVHVEDHPVEYATFEGVIPKGQYGGGTVMLWDLGRWEPLEDPRQSYKKGRLKFRLQGQRLQGAWMLVRLKGRPGEGDKNWLLIKERDAQAQAAADNGDVTEEHGTSVATGRSMEDIAASRDAVWSSSAGQEAASAGMPDPSSVPGSRRRPFPDKLRPQLATLAKDVPAGDAWLHEVKFDGYRLLSFFQGGRRRLITRNGLDWTAKFPAIVEELAELPLQDTILDGEIVVLDEDGLSDFQGLQNALSSPQQSELFYYIFDLPYYQGHDLTGTPLLERKAVLEAILSPTRRHKRLRYSDHIRGNGPAVLEAACSRKVEGLLSKRCDSTYSQSRSGHWLKVKCWLRREFVVGGYTEPSGSRPGFGALLLGLHDDQERLIYCGRVGTGFTEDSLKEIHSALEKLERKTAPFFNPPQGKEAQGLHWVRPELVAEVTFSNFTADGSLRHPSFQGLREDKSAGEVRFEEPVEPDPAPEDKPRTRPKAAAGTEVAGVHLSNPDRILYPDQGITKQALAQFYAEIGEWILPHLSERPLTLVRCPAGIQEDCFYQKHFSESLPDGIQALPLQEKEKELTYLFINSLEGLIGLVQMGVLEYHPWSSRRDRLEHPDQMIFDLDPDPDLGWGPVVEAALLLKELLSYLGLQSFAKLTGGKGIHVVTPLVRRVEWDELKEFSGAVAGHLAHTFPDRYTVNMSKVKRKGKIFIDFLRNGRGATAVAAYSTRARPGAPVAAPVAWEELTDDLRPDAFTVQTLPARMTSLKTDPWADFFSVKQSITKQMWETLGR